MYFVGENDLPCWQEMLNAEMLTADHEAWLADTTAQYPAQQESGIKYVTKLVGSRPHPPNIM